MSKTLWILGAPDYELTVVLRPEACGWNYWAHIKANVIASGWIKGKKSEARRHAIHEAKEALEEETETERKRHEVQTHRQAPPDRDQ